MKKILLCTDGSGYSMVSAEYVADVAKQTGAEIVAMYVSDVRQYEIPLVADLSGSLGVQPYADIMNQLEQVENHKAAFIDDQTREFFEKKGLADRYRFEHRTGLPVDALESIAENVDLVVLGKRGEHHEQAKDHLGSNMERIIRAVKHPCLVTNRAYRAINRVLVAYDGGNSCRSALEWMGAHAWLKQKEVHVTTAPEGHWDDQGAERLLEAETLLKASGVTAQYQLLGGRAEDSIAEYVTSNDVDLLIMGAYGHGPIRHLLIGSTTTEMLHHCHVPVLCFR